MQEVIITKPTYEADHFKMSIIQWVWIGNWNCAVELMSNIWRGLRKWVLTTLIDITEPNLYLTYQLYIVTLSHEVIYCHAPLPKYAGAETRHESATHIRKENPSRIRAKP